MEVRQTYHPGRAEASGSQENTGPEDRATHHQVRETAEDSRQDNPSNTGLSRHVGKSSDHALSAFIASDPASRRLLDHVKRLAAGNAPVLVRGEAGTGKDLVAWLLHYLGPHQDEPFLEVDCSNLPAELLSSEIFGDEPNGHPHPKRGRLELAGHGTLVLNEIAALTMPMQSKLLRIIERREFERNPRIGARIIALTTVDLERAMARRSFREDLYYRFAMNQVALVPLRDRRADIAPLAEHFLAQCAQLHRRPKPTVSPDAMRALQAFSFPGNVQQLRNMMERVVLTNAGPEILEEDLPSFVRQAPERPTMSLEDLERSHIADVLEFTKGKKSRAAQILGISRKTLLEKRKRYGME